MALFVNNVTIANGQSLSAAIDLGLGDLVRFYMPSAWTPGNLSFQLSPDNITFGDVFDATTGREFIIGVAAGACIVVGVQWRALSWLKIRSGTRAKPVVQTADRIFRLITSK